MSESFFKLLSKTPKISSILYFVKSSSERLLRLFTAVKTISLSFLRVSSANCRAVPEEFFNAVKTISLSFLKLSSANCSASPLSLIYAKTTSVSFLRLSSAN